MVWFAVWDDKATAGSVQSALGYNRVAESFFGSLKTERVIDSSYLTRDQARSDTGDYIEMFYNSTKRHSNLGYFSPAEFEKGMFLKKAA